MPSPLPVESLFAQQGLQVHHTVTQLLHLYLRQRGPLLSNLPPKLEVGRRGLILPGRASTSTTLNSP